MIINDCNVEATAKIEDETGKSLVIQFRFTEMIKMDKNSYERQYNCIVNSDVKEGYVIFDNNGNHCWISDGFLFNTFHAKHPCSINIKIESIV